MNRKIALLRKVDLFTTLKPDELDIVARYSEYYTYHIGETVFHEGEHDEELFIIKEGEVLISKHRSDQRDQDVARFISGEYFGEMDLLDDAPRSAVALAEKETTLLIFPKRGVSFQDILQKHPDIFAPILHKLLARIASRIRTANTLISEKVPWIQNVKKQVMNDALTGLYNRTFFDENFPALLESYEKPVSIIMIKPDRFKDINDNFGHDTGDNVLRYMAEFFSSKLTKDGIAIRFRGDEFALVLPNTDVSNAVKIAEEIREQMFGMDMSSLINGGKVDFTLSLGVSTYPTNVKDTAGMINRAVDLMFQARNNGGNSVCAIRG